MKLAELAAGYDAAGAQISGQLRRLRARHRAAQEPEARAALQYQIRQLTQVLTQLHELADLTRHYYESGYWRNGKYTL